MNTSDAIIFLSLSLYLLSGGRVTFSIALCVLYGLVKKNRNLKKAISSPEKKVGASPIYAVDFTSTTFTPDSYTAISSSSKFVTKNASRKRRGPAKVIKAVRPITKKQKAGEALVTPSGPLLNAQIYIMYTTLTGSSQRVANELKNALGDLENLNKEPKLLSLDDDIDDLEEYFLKVPKQETEKSIYILVLPSYETDSPIDYFLEHLQETYNDFRIDKYPLSQLLGFAVLGLGDSESWPGNKFCYQAEVCDKWLGKLGGRRLHPLGKVCVKFEGEGKANTWIKSFVSLMEDNEPFVIDEKEVDDSDNEEDLGYDSETLVDVEDMGNVIGKSQELFPNSDIKKMVANDSPTYKSLTKQGYTIVGSHSGVKICRWTKSALRGRGSCYKFAFYGIRSHLCMETTPSLACSNKCVFCWRHGTNPVAKLNWRWEVDPPTKIMEGALQGHYKKIKQMRGVPGVQMDRFEEAFKVRHCALSLVGEPIFYPHINEFVDLLHKQHISSFLVCNAQHPDQLAKLNRVTQLYVSIDAPTKSDLKKVDRPLNSDFWDRLMKCLDILRTTQSHQRTVFRLTLVKGFNMDEVEGYADMVIQAQPSQIEVKGATFCGSSNANGNPLTMQNIPFYEECKRFVVNLTETLRSRGHMYQVAAEHAHSCCILIAHEKFYFENKWHTHIDYPKFFSLLESGKEFKDIDYVTETPTWAYWGSDEAGFNPQDERYDRKAEKLKKKEQREKMIENVIQSSAQILTSSA